MDFLEDVDMRGVGVGLIVWLLYMVVIWKAPTLGADWQLHHQVLITILGLPVCVGMGIVAFQNVG